MAEEVGSAEAATEIALGFVRKHNLVASPLRAVRHDGLWLVEVDVGYIGVRVATFKIDATTGTILEYEFPEATLPPV